MIGVLFPDSETKIWKNTVKTVHFIKKVPVLLSGYFTKILKQLNNFVIIGKCLTDLTDSVLVDYLCLSCLML